MTTPTPTAPSPQASGQSPTPAEQGKALLRRLIEEVINQGRLEVTDELFSPQLARPPARASPPSAPPSPTGTWSWST
jgi:hypothetical protein